MYPLFIFAGCTMREDSGYARLTVLAGQARPQNFTVASACVFSTQNVYSLLETRMLLCLFAM